MISSHLQAQGQSSHVHVTPNSINQPSQNGSEQIIRGFNSAQRPPMITDFAPCPQNAPAVTSSQGQVNFQDFVFAPASALNVANGLETHSQAMSTNHGSQ